MTGLYCIPEISLMIKPDALIQLASSDGLINFLQNYVVTETGRMWLLPLCLPITLFAAWVFYRLIEKPSMKWSKKISYSESS